ncbi:hypothetical protein SBOR_7194 [Sclerotinia borealis F-4128]|uniref:DUF7924 domain-containing protein n=1 Tax=Sclerotinia borealis (strain F-4128) TaxID=1432307 RepID=W9CD20_SCLBF|nr:hypothetical protein SBOR_7194 [Sclerotinia borealis F-4128]
MTSRQVEQRDLQRVGLQVSTSQDQEMPYPQEQTLSDDNNVESKHEFPPSTSHTPPDIEPSQIQKGKRPQNEDTMPSITIPFRKRLRLSTPRPQTEDTACEHTAIDIDKKMINPLEYWANELCWPKEYFEPEENINLLAKKKSSTLPDKEFADRFSATTSITTPSDEKPRELRSAFYTNPSYPIVLTSKGSFMDKSDLGITDASKNLCRKLLETEQTVPRESLFNDETFEKACRNLQDKNEARVIQDIARLIVPSAESLATHGYGTIHLHCLIESVNEGWNRAIPFYGPRPQPDYSVGFERSAFTNDQLEKLTPHIGDIGESVNSFYMATLQMYFPFLTSEVKCSVFDVNAPDINALDLADRQNSHSMTLAVRGIVELFKLVGREEELHREILAFSISHDHQIVRIYGHYPVIDGKQTTFYRHPIHQFFLTAINGKDRWTAYQFTRNVYDIWMPTHLERIRSAIDGLPSNLDFEVSE